VAAIDVELAKPKHWDDVADLFTRKGPRGGTPQTNGCWCQFWPGAGFEVVRDAGRRIVVRRSLRASRRGSTG